jgi:hypothetical protein
MRDYAYDADMQEIRFAEELALSPAQEEIAASIG